jgi:hypothetical protein
MDLAIWIFNKKRLYVYVQPDIPEDAQASVVPRSAPSIAPSNLEDVNPD